MKKKNSKNSKKMPSSLISPGLCKMAERIVKIQKIAKQNGVFIYDRELLRCSKCGLTEDIAFSGKLFTYVKKDPNYQDTGLSFIALDSNNKRFKCPSCNTKILATEEE